MKERKINKALVVSVIVLVVIVLTFVVLFVYDLKFKNKGKDNKLPNNNKTEEKVEDNDDKIPGETVDEINKKNPDLKDPLVQKLFNYINLENDSQEFFAHKVGITKYENLAAGAPIKIAYALMDKNDIKYKKYDSKPNYNKCDIVENGINLFKDNKVYTDFNKKECTIESFKATVFEKKYKEIFGQDKNISRSKMNTEYYSKLCNYEKSTDSFYCGIIGEGGPWYSLESFSVLTKVEKIDNKIELYDSYFYATFDNIYKDSSEENFLSEKKSDITVPTSEEVIKNGGKFKHTFNKNSDGTYYWYSSEMIE